MRAVLALVLLSLAAFALAYPAYSQVATEGAGPAEVPGGLIPGDKTTGPVASVEADETKFDSGFYSMILGIMNETPADGDPGVHDGERYYDVILVVSRDDGDDRDPDEVARENKDAVVKRLEQLGARDIAAAGSLSFVTASVPVADVPGFSLHDEVYRIGDGEIPVTLDLNQALGTINARPANVTSAVGRGVDGAGVTVAVIDTGIERRDMFGDRISHTTICDDMGCENSDAQSAIGTTSHGTKVAQIVAGSGPGHHGVAPDATLLDIMYYNVKGGTVGVTNFLAHALDYAHLHGAHVVNMSFSIGICSTNPESFDLIVNEAVDKGLIAVKTAGNNNHRDGVRTVYQNIGKPGCADNVITVGSIDDRNLDNIVMANFTSRGPSTGSTLLKPEIVAPGGAIQVLANVRGSATVGANGTSFSAPMVSGAAALVLEAYPELTPVEAKAALLLGATWTGPVPCTSAQYDEDDPRDGCSHARKPSNYAKSNSNRSLEILNNVGFGILNASRTLEYASNEGTDRHVIGDSISDGDDPKQYRFRVTNTDEPVKVILSWLTQPHGGIFDQRNRTAEPATADLNLRITGPGYEQTADSEVQVNEFAVFNPPQAGLYTVTVTGTNLDDIPKPAQNYAIAATLPLDPVPDANSPPTVESRTIAIDPENSDPVAVRLFGSDMNGDALSFSVTRGPASGTASTTEYIDDWVSRMIYNYTGSATATGTLDSFGVVASDGQAVGAGGTVTIVSENLPPGATRVPSVPDGMTEWRIVNAADHFSHGARSFTIPDGHEGATALVVESTGMDHTKLTINTDDGAYTIAVPDSGTRQIDLAAPLAISSMVLESDGVSEEIVHENRTNPGSDPADARIRVGLVGAAGEDAKSASFSASSYPDSTIPDNTKNYSTSDTIVVPVKGTIHDVTVSVSILHTYSGDLRVALTAPDGTETVLNDNAGGSRDDVVETYSSQLEGLAGSKTDGNWRLSIGDHKAGDVGRLASWDLEISYTPDDPPLGLQLPGTVLFTDDFESKDLSKWTESGEGDWRIGNSRSHAVPILPGHSWTNNVLHVDNCDTECTMSMADPVDLSPYGSAVLTFDRYIDLALDPTDYLRVEAYDGDSWNLIFHWTHGQGDDDRWHHESFDLADHITQDDFQVRLVAQVTSPFEDIQVDRVKITASGVPMFLTISAPANATFEATGHLTPLTAGQIGAPKVSDVADPAPAVTNDAPAEGFPLGETIVTWTATNSAGHSATATQTITIQDTTPPAFDPPVLEDTSPGGLVLPVATDLVDGPVPVTSSHAFDYDFPDGTTVVTFTATDSSGNSARITQNVVVASPAAPSTLISDTFGSSLDGWEYRDVPNTSANDRYCRAQHTGAYNLEHSSNRGGSALTDYSRICWFGTAGGTKSFTLASSGTLQIEMDYRSLSSNGRHTNNMHLMVLDSGGNILHTEELYQGLRTAVNRDSGWGTKSFDAGTVSPSQCPCRIYVYLSDSWQHQWRQQNYFDNVDVTLVPPGASGASAMPPSSLTEQEYLAGLFSNGTRIVPVAERVHPDGADIAWEPLDGAAGYTVEVSPKSDPSETAKFAVSGTEFRIPGLEPGTEYEVRIGASGDDSTQTVLDVATPPRG